MSSEFRVHSSESKIKSLRLFTFYFLLLSFVGCSTITETAKGFLGISTKILEEKRKDAIRQSFKYDYETCFNKTIKILKELKAYIYREDKKRHLIAIYVSREDTTCVGIFFTEIDADNTQVEVSSPSTSAKENIATQLFAKLIMTGYSK